MKKIIFLFAPLCAMLMVGCAKDEPNATFIKLYAEGFTPDNSAKAAVSGERTYWVDGEDVWINHNKYDISVNGSGEAVASDVYQAPDHVYRAVYPASVYYSRSGNNVTINVPKHYYYQEDGSGRQVLDGLPMVAYHSGDADPEELAFKHVTAAIAVRVKNTTSNTIAIDRVVLINSQYQLGGNVTLDISGAGGSGKPTVNPIKLGAPDSVTIHFTDTNHRVSSEMTFDVQIPILPVGGSADADLSNFTVKVYGHHKGTRYIYSRSTGDRNNSIARACLGGAVAKYANDAYCTTADLYNQKTIDGKNYYEITSADELVCLSAAMDNRWDNSTGDSKYNYGNYVVTEDIDLNGVEFTPIHYYNEDSETECTFDGGGHTVSNFVASSINENDPNVCGFFGKTEGSNITIKDLNIEYATYEFNHQPNVSGVPYATNPCTAVGGIMGLIDKPGITISGCSASNIIFAPQNDAGTQTDMYASGIAGYVTEECTISNCSVGSVLIDNSNQESSGMLIDQFGAAIGRIDVGYTSSINFTWADTVGGISDSPNPKRITIENFTYTQGTEPMVFVSGLKNVRYGGLIGNVTEGGIIEISNVKLHHNVLINQPTGTEYEENGVKKYRDHKQCGGMIGWMRSSHDVAIVLNAAGCVVDGYVKIQGAADANSAKNGVSQYIGVVQSFVEPQGDLSCSNSLTFTDDSQCTGAVTPQKLDFQRRKPSVTTINNTGSVTVNSITCKGKVEKPKKCNYNVTDRGICWASYFTLGNHFPEQGYPVDIGEFGCTVVACPIPDGQDGYGEFSVLLTGLTSDASHYYRAYATFEKRSASDPTSTISVTITAGTLSTKHKTLKS